MPNYTITLTDDEDRALRTQFVDPDAWLQGLVRSRLLDAQAHIIAQEINTRLDTGEAIPSDRLELLRTHKVKSAAQVAQEKEAAAAAVRKP